MKVKLVTLFVSLLIVMSLAACSNNDAKEEENVDEKVISEESSEDITENSTFLVESAIGDLSYPEKWKDILQTETTDNKVVFSAKIGNHDEVVLFTLEFGESSGYLLGTLDSTNIYIVDNSVEFDDSWTEAEKNEVYAMQEDVNVILQGLMEKDNFVLAN